MPEVHIIFDGIIAIGPPYPSMPPYKRRGPLFAILPHAPRQQDRRSEIAGTTPRFIPLHMPGLFTTMKDTGRPADLDYGGFKLWCPLRERWEFSFDPYAEADTLEYQHDGTFNPSCTNKDVERDAEVDHKRCPPVHDIAAVSDMREIWPERSRLRRGVLAKPPFVRSDVAAQVFVPSGKICSGTDDPEKCGVCVVYQPKKTPEECLKRIVPQVIVTVNVKTSIEIHATSLDTGKKLDSIVLVPTAEGEEIRIANGDLCNFQHAIDQLNKPPESVKPLTGEATDFELHYKLLEGCDEGGLPIPCSPCCRLAQRPCYTALVEGTPESPSRIAAWWRRITGRL